jgi:hypothetical protein
MNVMLAYVCENHGVKLQDECVETVTGAMTCRCGRLAKPFNNEQGNQIIVEVPEARMFRAMESTFSKHMMFQEQIIS